MIRLKQKTEAPRISRPKENCDSFGQLRFREQRKGEWNMKTIGKKVLALLLCAGMLLLVLPTTIFRAEAATSGSCGTNMTWSFNTSTGHLTIKGSGTMKRNTPWREDYSSAITSVSIGYGVENISDFAFYGCKNLKTVTIPSSVKELGEYAFQRTAIESIVIPNSVTKIAQYCFSSCEELVAVDLPDNLKYLGSDAFANCEKLRSIDIPGTLSTIPSYCFSRNYALKELVLPEGVMTIGSHAFFACGIQKISLPRSLTEIRAYAFKGSGLREITIPHNITIIEEFTFDQCMSLERVNFPNTLREIRHRAFSECESLKRVILPSSLEYLGSSCFSFSENLETIMFLSSDTNIDMFAFDWAPYVSGYEGSTAQQYAKGHELEFRPLTYDDVMPWEWYYGATQYATDKGLMNGVGTRKFNPEGLTNRGMLVTILWRYAGERLEGSNIFVDVDENLWYAPGVAWASYNQIVNGVGDQRFNPMGTVTREQMAVILFRYCNMLGIDTSNRASLEAFSDGEIVSSWAEDAISWAVAEGLINGNRSGEILSLDPTRGATRAQTATILMRFIENILKDQ